MSDFGFALLAEDAGARRGRLTTPRGTIETPAFMPVGTAATVKALLPDQVRATGAEIILANTYHLMLRPGAERVAALGGLHEFMGWDGPILTDSGGFQVMSLAKLRKLDENGVRFQSHIDGSEHLLTPERSIAVQNLLGADIQMQFDECPPLPSARTEVERAMELSLRWAERSRAAFDTYGAPGRTLFAIVQGGIDRDLRARSAEALKAMDFPGYAVGGLAVGEGQEAMLATLDHTAPRLPTTKPRYLMGVGKPDDIIEAVARGVDMFDCVLPTRSGRHGQAFTWDGPVNIKNARFADDGAPLSPDLDCPASRDFSRAYLHHLFKAGELLGQSLLSWHNVAFYQKMMSRLRASIDAGRFSSEKSEILARYRGV